MKDIEALERNVARLVAELNTARIDLTCAKIAACGVSIGDIVVKRGTRYQVCDIDVHWTRPWLKGNKRLKDGSWGVAAHNLYDDWVKELQESGT